MDETANKRRREKYSRLICLGCRSRRIRCVLPDTSILPSSEPQPISKACQRCSQNGLDCIVDYTTSVRCYDFELLFGALTFISQTGETSTEAQQSRSGTTSTRYSVRTQRLQNGWYRGECQSRCAALFTIFAKYGDRSRHRTEANEKRDDRSYFLPIPSSSRSSCQRRTLCILYRLTATSPDLHLGVD